MSFDPERLRALANAKQAEYEENDRRELAAFEAEKLAALSEWLNAQLECAARDGSRSVTLKFDSNYPGHSTAFNDPTLRESGGRWYAYLTGPYDFDLGADRLFYVGSFTLPISGVAGRVIELLQKAGITATLSDTSSFQKSVDISW